MVESIERLTSDLRERGNHKSICTQDTDLVVEGYPRSANSFCVGFIDLLAKRDGRDLRIAHHTHLRENCELAAMLNRPCLVLIRDPIAAISSYMIYVDVPVAVAVRQYLRFYEWADRWAETALFASFDLVTSDMNRVISALNRHFELNIQESIDPASDGKEVTRRSIAMARTRHTAENFVKKVGMPSAEREGLKADIKPHVIAYLDENPDVQALYDHVRSLPNFLG